MVKTICVAGAGTMGSGIALAAAQSGFSVIIFDLDREALHRSENYIEQYIRQLTGKEKITESEGLLIFKRMQFVSTISNCIAGFFIEAIIEDAAAKISMFNQLAAINDAGAIFATNTSSLSVSLIQEGVVHPERVAGMHFFNPAPVMKLIEIVKGKHTNEATMSTIGMVCSMMGKTPVHCIDSPGFIVNRIARHYYLEAMKLVESGITTIENADAVMEASGFKMGPFRLMDLIGIDINLAVSKSIYEALGHAERFRPSFIQEQKVQKAELGRKSGKGFYTYSVNQK